jgi:hypothetical protein
MVVSGKRLGVFESSTSCGDRSNDVLDAIRPHNVTLNMLVKIENGTASRSYRHSKGDAWCLFKREDT